VPEQTLVALQDDAVVGVYLISWPLLLVAPAARRCGHGRALVTLALAEAEQPERVEIAPPPGNVVAEAFARALGFAYHASLWRLRLPADAAAYPPQIPHGFVLRAFRPGDDDAAYLHAIVTSFADHPSPMVLNLDLLRRAHARPTFSAADIAVVTPNDDPAQIVGFCRLLDTHTAAEEPEAEVSVIGVLPEQRGLGLGRELLRWGIDTLRTRGAGDVTLNVEGRNEHALRLYTRHGFVHDMEWQRWTVADAATPS
jgi:mycothiol synthase